MTYELYIGDRSFSSWSMRGWLMLRKFGLPFNTTLVGLYSGTMAQDIAHLAPARTVPVMQTPEGHVLSDSLSMAETLVERHPNVNFYPKDPAARALARNLVAEMHSGFSALRDQCPCMITHVWEGFSPSAAVRADVERITELWSIARTKFGQSGPWLFGEYSLADVFYAPVAYRFTAFDMAVDAAAQLYVDAHLSDPAFHEWRAEALEVSYDPFPYPFDLNKRPWPGDKN